MRTLHTRTAFISLLFSAALTQGCAQNTNDTSSGDNVQWAAATPGTQTSYLGDSASGIVRSAQRECVRTSNWNPENVVAGCDDVAVVEAPQATIGNSLVNYNGRALFEFDSSELTSGGQSQLNNLVARLNAQDQIEAIEIVGHADSKGSDAYNQTLSEKRANTVRSYLEPSLKSVSVTVNGMGETAPVADNSTETGRSQNRRVDVIISALVE